MKLLAPSAKSTANSRRPQKPRTQEVDHKKMLGHQTEKYFDTSCGKEPRMYVKWREDQKHHPKRSKIA